CAGGALNGSQLTLALGESATCTINNDDQTSHLKLVKTVTNDNGGTKNTTDFTLSAAGPTPISGAGGAESDVNAGTYTLTETNVPGYTASNWSCTSGSLTGNQLTLALGHSATCTITNDDQPGTLIVNKVVINDDGGTKKATDFSFRVDGGTAQAFGPGSDDQHGTKSITVNAGAHNITEPAVTGYTPSYSNCSNVTVTNGGTATCTIRNDDQPAHLTVEKHVVNNNGGSATAGQWTMDVTATNPSNNHFAGSEAGITIALDAGAYSVDESGGVSGY